VYSVKKIVKKIDVPFTYTVLVAFSSLLKYEDKREIDIETLVKYRDCLLSNALNEHLQFSPNEIVLINPLDLKNNLSFPDNMFYMKGHTLILKDEYDLDYLLKSIKDFDVYIHSEIDFVSRYNKQCKNLLGISKISKSIMKYLKTELELEKCYSILPFTVGQCEDKIKELLLKRNSFYGDIILKNSYNLDCYQTELFDLMKKQDDVYLEKSPIDKEFLANNLHYDIEDEDFVPVSQVVDNSYIRAIFDSNSLAFSRINEDITNLYFNFSIDNCDNDYNSVVSITTRENFKDYGCFVYTDTSNDELLFYMCYIRKINEIMSLYGSNDDLKKTLGRLLYLIDSIGYKLYDGNSFNEFYNHLLGEYNNCSSDAFMDIFYYWKSLAYFFIEEIFNVKSDDVLVYKKIALISCYYELTHDKHIVDLLTKYSDNENYFKYYKLIVGVNRLLNGKTR